MKRPESWSVWLLFVLQLWLAFLFWLLITGYWGYVVTIIKEVF